MVTAQQLLAERALIESDRDRLRSIVQMLATHMACLAVFVKSPQLRDSSTELANAALGYLASTDDTERIL